VVISDSGYYSGWQVLIMAIAQGAHLVLPHVPLLAALSAKWQVCPNYSIVSITPGGNKVVANGEVVD
jgi:hypothetical protein